MFLPVYILFCFVSVESMQPFTSFQLPSMLEKPKTKQTETERKLDELTAEIEELKKFLPSGGIQTQEASGTTNNNADIETMKTSIDQINAKMSQVNNTVETVKTETTSLEQSLQQIQTTANQASSEVGTMKQTLQQAETRFEEKQQELESSVDKLKYDMVQQEELGQERCIHGEQQYEITMNAIVTKIIKDEGVDRLSFVDADGSPSDSDRPVTLAIDGRLDQTHPSCTHTKNDANPWWEGDLGTVAEVHQLTLYNRVDCCSNRLVNFKIEGYGTQTRQSPLLCKKVDDASGLITTIQCDNPIQARYIRITKYDDLVLTLCEVIAGGFHLPKKPQGHTVQISTASIDSGANLAYDGNPDTCSETADEAEGAWWQINLSEMTTIVSVDVTNRKDDKYESLSDIEIVMYESQPSGCVDRPFTVCGSVVRTVEAGETVTVVCDPPVTGRYLRLNKKSEGALSMCEIVMRKPVD